jgi:hypothetical protein
MGMVENNLFIDFGGKGSRIWLRTFDWGGSGVGERLLKFMRLLLESGGIFKVLGGFKRWDFRVCLEGRESKGPWLGFFFFLSRLLLLLLISRTS